MPVLIQSHLAYQIIRAFQAAYVGHRLLVECREKSSRNVNCLRFHEMSFQKYKPGKIPPRCPVKCRIIKIYWWVVSELAWVVSTLL